MATPPSLVPQSQRISAEEYYQLRRQLLRLRRQHAQTLHGDRGRVQPKHVRRLEKRIHALEHQLALSEPQTPDEPLTLGEILAAIRQSAFWHLVRTRSVLLKHAIMAWRPARLRLDH